jgi:hypothetical protein
MRPLVKVLLGVLVLLAVLQLIRVDQTNPPVTADVAAPPNVKEVLRRACYDCHSNETVWPWYSRIAPISWAIHYDMAAGRSSVNFSVWGTLTPEERGKLLKETAESVAEGEMPPWYYLPVHPQARLSSADKRLLSDWAGSKREEEAEH